MRRPLLLVLSLCLLSFPAVADEPGDRDEIVVPPPPRTVREVVTQEKPVTAAPPAWVEVRRRALGAGIGVQWGRGVLHFEGEDHAFRLQGLSVGDLGISSSDAVGDVENLTQLADLAGHYLAVEAGVAAGPGRSALKMRNEKGVEITLYAREQGGRLVVGPQGLRLTFE
jgi:hypothetical protein